MKNLWNQPANWKIFVWLLIAAAIAMVVDEIAIVVFNPPDSAWVYVLVGGFSIIWGLKAGRFALKKWGAPR
jgi:hypothetical protein